MNVLPFSSQPLHPVSSAERRPVEMLDVTPQFEPKKTPGVHQTEITF